jgi:hypothetical protein
MKRKSITYYSSKASSNFKTFIFDERLMNINFKFDEMMRL